MCVCLEGEEKKWCGNKEKGEACAFGMWFQGLLWGASRITGDDLELTTACVCWLAGEVAACPL